ncbi:MAG: elongation factor Ts [Deltaproteobacteria bacterium]|nr:elongation factor Ts [Deltaproteobacteria bacterium]
MSITAQDVKNLREKTGAGMMDCKKALMETNGSFDAAVDFLKKEGLAKAVKKGDRIAAEGLVFSKVTGDSALLLEVNCETDFVAKNEDFIRLGNKLVDFILTNKPKDCEALLKMQLDGVTVQDVINSNISVIGEKISLRRFYFFKAKEGGKIALYSHSGGKIAVLIEITGEAVTEEAGINIAMQIAAMSPEYIDKSQVARDVLDKEKEIQMEQLKKSGKPPEMLEKIIIGKLNKFAGEISLMQQIYVKDMGGKQSVGDYLKQVDKTAKVIQFVRYAVGEGLEKKKDDFAAEVSRMTQ